MQRVSGQGESERRATAALRWLAIGLARGYQLIVSPVLHGLAGPGFGCRFAPTCSQYAIECLRTLPLGKALSLAARRILRCHPWGGSGYDPPPKG